MIELQKALEDYLTVRRRLGFKLRGIDSGMRAFVTFMEHEEATFVTADLALRWAKQSTTTQPRTWASRLQMVRGFAKWLTAIDPRTEVPPTGILPSHYPRKPPYIYTDEEVSKLVHAASELPGLKGFTYSTFFGLLAVTGMRISEGLALDRKEVDLEKGILMISQTKCSKSRLVPIHESTRKVLTHYAKERDRTVAELNTPAFFVSERGNRVSQWTAREIFAKVSCKVGLAGSTSRTSTPTPRAIFRLKAWAKAREEDRISVGRWLVGRSGQTRIRSSDGGFRRDASHFPSIADYRLLLACSTRRPTSPPKSKKNSLVPLTLQFWPSTVGGAARPNEPLRPRR